MIRLRKWKEKRLLDDPATEAAVKDYLQRDWQTHYKPLSREEFVIFDLETTGLDPNTDLILSFAFLRARAGTLILAERLEGYIGLERGARLAAADIHHVTRQEVSTGLTERAFGLSVLDFIGTTPLVGHHVAFDMACLNRLMGEHFGLTLRNKVVDTARLAARIENPLMGGYAGNKAFKSLDALCRDFDIEPEARHSASGDALTTAILFLKLLKKAQKRGIKKL